MLRAVPARFPFGAVWTIPPRRGRECPSAADGQAGRRCARSDDGGDGCDDIFFPQKSRPNCTIFSGNPPVRAAVAAAAAAAAAGQPWRKLQLQQCATRRAVVTVRASPRTSSCGQCGLRQQVLLLLLAVPPERANVLVDGGVGGAPCPWVSGVTTKRSPIIHWQFCNQKGIGE